ncbi:MAG TPA: hypothetical protein VHK26_02215 [Methyloceanibacter sp.]|jgi:hypothetical protein|nr:hypothetical protein [Methyloceanibacter sp.]
MRGQAQAHTRRASFALALAAVLVLLLAATSIRAQESTVAKAAAWRIGDQLSLAGLLYAQGGEDENVKELLASIKPLTDAIKIEVKPFPPRGETQIETYAAVIEYLIKGDGAEIGRQIGKDFGNNAGLLFEISVKSNLLILLYEPGDDQGIGSVIQSRCNEVGLPHNLWLDVVNAVNSKASKDEVKNAVFKMHDDVAAYLNQQVQ